MGDESRQQPRETRCIVGLAEHPQVRWEAQEIAGIQPGVEPPGGRSQVQIAIQVPRHKGCDQNADHVEDAIPTRTAGIDRGRSPLLAFGELWRAHPDVAYCHAHSAAMTASCSSSVMLV